MKKEKIMPILMSLLLILGICQVINKSFRKKTTTISAYDEIFAYQAKVDQEITSYLNNVSYTLDNPQVLINPYKIAPLTALIIFKTPDATAITLNINGKDITTFTKSQKHLIPVYGLYANYENKIILKTNNQTKELLIKTEPYTGDKITIEKTSNNIKNNLYFISPNFVDDVIINGEGKVLWYLDGDYAGDIELLDNNHFYIGDAHQGLNGVKINYSSFLEMDFLGKIHKQYITEYGLHHEMIPLSNNKMLVLGYKDDSPFYDSYLYIMDLTTGQIIEELDLYEFIKKLNPVLVNKLGNHFDLVNNSADYNEDTKDLLLSLRGLNSLIKLNLETQEIKWIFGAIDIWGEDLQNYLLTPTDNTRFLGGQHSAFYTKDGLIAVHNNDIDQFDLANPNLSHYVNRYSSFDLLKVDEKKKTIKTVWQYTANKKEFSNVGGHIELLNNNHKLLTYGWSMKEEAYKNPNQVIYTDPAHKNGVVLELDQNDNVLFRLSMPGLIYRTFQIDGFYQAKTENYVISNFNRINSTTNNGQLVNINKIKLTNAPDYNNEISIINNRITLKQEFNKTDLIFTKNKSKMLLNHLIRAWLPKK